MSRKILERFTIILALLLFAGVTHAKHIIGGVITYDCLGNGRYEFTLKVYRDCNCTDCANFDEVAYIAVYNCSGSGCNGQTQNTPFLRINAQLLSVSPVEAPDYPCLIPPDVCVQEGVYQFEATLPPSSLSYHISYQRCCRNVTISNIFAPEDTGATYSIEITPRAQQLCNDSPVFDDFPPTVICAGSPLEFDHSATDPNGDQLVYSFCSPLQGGGPITNDAAIYNSCIGAQPIPACPPPYPPVAFRVPAYTATAPMGGNPVIDIDPNTGMITGTPTALGQFVVGVCVEEYRDGELLSRVFRDFQFNVARCDPTVVAQIASDEVINSREYVVVSCGENTVSFRNESFQRNNIDVWNWAFDIEGQMQSFNDWSPSITFPDTGTYFGQLILNPNTTCGDTADIRVEIYPEIRAGFSFEYDTCLAGPTTFTDESFSGSGQLTDWSWAFGDGQGSNQQHPVHTFREPGNFPVTLEVTDINGCKDALTRPLPYYPIPELIVIAPSTFTGCVPASIFFDNLSVPINEEYDILWEFGDGGTATTVSPTYLYERAGTYTVSIDIVSPLGCQTDTTFTNLITVLPSPVAGFSFSPEQPSNIEPTVNFFDESIDAIRWLYDFGTGQSSSIPNPAYTFPDTGLFEVMQVVTHPSGCTDTLLKTIDIRPEVRYFLPNAFTPNNDGTNDEYLGAGVMEGATAFSLTIWNRWGELVFQTSDPFEGWNGRKHNTGSEVPAGVYMVLVTFNGPRGEPFELQGVATVVR
ncbi:MAG: PKD domain-containing protein [Phaeodactylibacter sp.]|nr:PKD domain-containing protein [Phaeodactylibacter sp.]